MKIRSIVLLALVVLLLATSVAPVLAAGPTPSHYSPGGQTLIFTASSPGQPQGAIIGGQYVRLATEDCPMPARMLVDGQIVYACPRPVKLPPLPRPPLRLP